MISLEPSPAKSVADSASTDTACFHPCLSLCLSIYLSIDLSLWFAVFALEEQLKKCLRDSQPFPSSSHMQDCLKVRVKGQHCPSAISGSQPLLNLWCWETKLCWGRASCPSPRWGDSLQLGFSAGLSPKQGPGRKCWAAEPHPSLASYLPPSVLGSLRTPCYCSSLECLKRELSTPVWKKKHSRHKNQKKISFTDYSLWETTVA